MGTGDGDGDDLHMGRGGGGALLRCLRATVGGEDGDEMGGRSHDRME